LVVDVSRYESLDVGGGFEEFAGREAAILVVYALRQGRWDDQVPRFGTG
jgi:hypothetical protein